MLFICRTNCGVAYFCRNSFATRVEYNPSEFLYEASGSLSSEKYEYVIGNDLLTLANKGIIGHCSPTQKYIDVCLYGLKEDLINTMGLSAIVYVYNNWVNHEDAIMPYDKLKNEMWTTPIQDDYIIEKIKVSGNYKSRFKEIMGAIKDAETKHNFMGIVWPTCHYLSDLNPYIYVYYKKRKSVFRKRELKPAQLI